MIEIKVKDSKVKIHMSGRGGELLFEMYSVLDRIATGLKTKCKDPAGYREFCEMLRTIADGKTTEEYRAKLVEELKNYS